MVCNVIYSLNRVGVCMMCVGDNEERERGDKLSETLFLIGVFIDTQTFSVPTSSC